MEKTNYQVLMEKAENCLMKAASAGDVFMQKFYYNAAKGYENKAHMLTLQEAVKGE